MTNTNNPIELLVSIKADTAGSKAGIQSQLNLLSKQLESLNVGIKIDDQSIKNATSGVDKLGMKFEEVVHSTQKAEKAQRDLERAASTAADKIGADWGKAGRKMLTSIEQVEKEFKGKDFTIKSNFDVKSGKNSLKSFQVDVKQTEDIIERVTYKLRDMGNGVVGFEPSSMQRIDKAAFDLSKNLNAVNDKLKLLNQEGKISNATFNELSEKASKIGKSSGFKKFESDIKSAVIAQNQLNTALRSQEELSNKVAGSLSNRTMSVAKNDLEQTKAKNAALDAQYAKYVAINAKIDEQVFKQKLTQSQGDIFKSNIGVQMPIAQLKEQETLIGRQVVLNQRNAAELKNQVALQEKIRMLINKIVSEQGRNPKGFGNSLEVNNMLSTLRGVDPAAKGASASVKGVSDSFQKMSSEAQSAGKNSMGVMESFSVAMQKFPIWMAASTAFYSVVRGIKSAVTQIIDIDSQMTVMARVTSGQMEVNDVLAESIRLAGELGNKIADVNEGFIAFARQGFRGEDLTMMAEYATLLGNISDMSVEESSSVLTAGIKGFNIEAKDAVHIVNALNEVDRHNCPLC